MAVLSIAALKAEIDAWVYENTTFDITGDHMNTILNDIVDSLNAALNVDSWNIIDAAFDASANPDYPNGDAGDVYVVKVAGKIGGASGLEVNVGDVFFCLADGTTTGNQVTKGEFWNILQGRLQTDIYAALAGAASPSAGNVFATMADVAGGGMTMIDISWASFLALGGVYTAGARYHINTAPDGSTTIDEAWIDALSTSQLADEGFCLINAANITNRLAKIKFFMAGGTGGKISGVYDAQKNEVEGYAVVAAGTSSTGNIDSWLDALTAANQSIKIHGSVLSYGGASTLSDYSRIHGGTVSLQGASTFFGTIENGSATLDNAANANGVYILGAGSLILDNGAILANGFVGAGKTLSMIAGETVVGFSTEGNTKLSEYAPSPTGDTANVDNSDGVVHIVDGSTDVAINMPTGLIAGQQMMIYFKAGSAAVTWGGAAVDAVTFPVTFSGGDKIMAFWDAANTTWR